MCNCLRPQTHVSKHEGSTRHSPLLCRKLTSKLRLVVAVLRRISLWNLPLGKPLLPEMSPVRNCNSASSPSSMSAAVAITRTFASASISERVFRLLLAALVVIGASLSLFAQDITVSPATLRCEADGRNTSAQSS